jgi:vacuolar protein sorting-associated protein 45
MNRENNGNILLGGTYVHNSRTFLAEINQISYEKKDKFDINLNDGSDDIINV